MGFLNRISLMTIIGFFPGGAYMPQETNGEISGGSTIWTNFRVHFVHCHMLDTIVILEEGNRPYPRCPNCDMFVSHKALKGRNLTTSFCRQGEERKRCRLSEEEAWVGDEV